MAHEKPKKNKRRRSRARVVISSQETARNTPKHKRMKVSAHHLAAIVESAEEAIIARNLDGIVTSWNKGAERLCGYTAEEMIGKHVSILFSTIIPPERSSDAECIDRKRYNEEQIRYFETECIKEGGRRFTASMTISPIRDSSGRMIGSSTIVRDITERKRRDEELKRHLKHLEELLENRTRELSESEERFRKIFNSNPSPYTITTIDGRIIDVNDAWVDVLGYSREEAIGHTLVELGATSEQEAHERQQRIAKALQTGRSYCADTTKLSRSGKTCIFSNNLAAVELNGRQCILNMLIDITDQVLAEKRLRESEERYRGIAERSFDTIIIIDRKGNVIYASPSTLLLTGYAPSELIGRPLQSILTVKATEKTDSLLQEVLNGGIALMRDTEIVREDGSIAHVEINASPVMNRGTSAGAQIIIRDVSERLKLEKMRNQFISTVTHELRTPLVSILGYLDLSLTAKPGLIPEETLSDLQVVKRNADRLLSLVNDLLDINRMQSGRIQLNLEQLDLKSIIGACADEATPLLAGKELKLELPDKTVPVRADRIRITQVLMNLISNAAKFSPERAEVTIHLEERDGTVIVNVSDRGIGIRKEDLESVFEPFATVQKPNYIKGTGLGLSISKGLIEAHGGKMWAESEGEGKGAVFNFTIPRLSERN